MTYSNTYSRLTEEDIPILPNMVDEMPDDGSEGYGEDGGTLRD